MTRFVTVKELDDKTFNLFLNEFIVDSLRRGVNLTKVVETGTFVAFIRGMVENAIAAGIDPAQILSDFRFNLYLKEFLTSAIRRGIDPLKILNEAMNDNINGLDSHHTALTVQPEQEKEQ